MKKVTKNDKRKKYKDKLQKRQELMIEADSQKKKKEKVEKRESIIDIETIYSLFFSIALLMLLSLKADFKNSTQFLKSMASENVIIDAAKGLSNK